jgi:hypothetical protein
MRSVMAARMRSERLSNERQRGQRFNAHASAAATSSDYRYLMTKYPYRRL